MESTSGQSEKVPKNSDPKEGSHDTVKKSSGKKQSESAPKKFAILSTDYIKVIADSCGISELSEDVAPALAEDASYKLREVIHYCSIYWKNTKRKKLMVEDVSRVFNVLNVPTIYGHSEENETEFIRVPSSDVFITNDADQDVVSIATSDKELAPYMEPYIRGTWLIAEPFEPPGENKDSKQKEPNANTKPGTSGETAASSVKTPSKPGGKSDDPPGASRPPPHLLNYYLQVAKVIISGSTYLLEVAINDLRTNPNVGPVCPYFLNLVALSVNKLQRHAWLTDALLSTVKALVENQFVDPSCYLAANRAANSLLVIAIEPKIASNCDDLLLRSRAAELLSKVLFTWTIEMKQQMDIVRQLLQLLLDKNISLQSQYGAIVCLISLGYRILLMYFWPVMERYFPLLEEKYKTSSSADIAHVKGAILAAAEVMYRKDWDVCTPEEAKRRLRIDYLLYDYFGDSSIPRRQQYSNERTIYPNKSSNVAGDASKTESNLVMDYDFDYQNWNPSYMIQRKPYMQNTNPYIRKNQELPATDINTVFEKTNMVDRTNNIIFNFVGSNQIDNNMLKKKKLDPKQVSFDSLSHKLTGLWYKQNIYKNTRTTKYCVKWHTKCCTGDLFTIL